MEKPIVSFRNLQYKYLIGTVCLLIACGWLYRRPPRVITRNPPAGLAATCGDAYKTRKSIFCCPKSHKIELPPSDISSAPSYLQMLSNFTTVCHGSWLPPSCQPLQKVAILVPYRDRELHLRLLLQRLHLILQHQNVAYSIFVIEQGGTDPFNRGLLMNIGIRESLLRDPNITCFVFHDVDLLPDNSRNLYFCDSTLRHLSSGIDEFRYHVPFANYAGGVTSLSKENVLKINGFPNRYWGWGNEDDELSARCMIHSIKLSRPPEHIGQYQSVSHVKATRGEGHYQSFLGFRGFQNDGLNALTDASYHIQKQRFSTSLLPISLPEDLGDCARTQLANSLNVSVDALNSVSQMDNRKQNEINNFLSQVLYTHVTVDVSPVRQKQIQPLEYTQESLIWFLNFYGWI